MIGGHNSLRLVRDSMHRAWPCWALLAFAGGAVAYLIPGGYIRAVVAIPVMLIVPGSLTLGALLGSRNRLPDAAFACFAALLSITWWVFASLILYLLGILITASSTYWALLLICTFLAAVAQARLVRDYPASPARPTATYTRYYPLAALVAGAGLLIAGVFTWDHIHHPASPGYTWLAWTGPPHDGVISIGAAGRELPFEIVDRQHGAGTFRVQAMWLGSQARPLAKPETVRVGPGQTLRGAVFVPRLPNACNYRIVITVTGVGQVDPLTKRPQSWSINADVRGADPPTRSGKPAPVSGTCRR
jgi:hypothetical protein